ncbi:MAG: gliding motility protein GldL [Flavobacteriales bacterium]|nr:gliding motility protein GldL [Flavobacteriales bacterium]
MAKLYGWGAAVVIVGALFKIEHWPGASAVLIVGLSVEAFIFFMSAFEPPHEEVDWSLVYPELATGESREESRAVGGSLTQQLDGMLAEAKIEPDLIASLGDGMRSLSDQARSLNDITDASAATQEYSSSLRGASVKVSELADTYRAASESLTGLTEQAEAGASTGTHLKKMSDNLSSLNDMYELQLQELERTRTMYSGMGELISNLHDSVEDTRKYKESIAELAQNLQSLNTVYSNMLNAMGAGARQGA